jgi:hypothetical protein
MYSEYGRVGGEILWLELEESEGNSPCLLNC